MSGGTGPARTVQTVCHALPLGVPLTFAPGPDIRTRKTFAFFDLSVWGMSGNVFPFLTAVLSVVVFFLLLWILLRPRELGKRETVSQVLAFLLVFGTILSMMMAGGATVVGVLIAVLLLVAAVLQIVFV